VDAATIVWFRQDLRLEDQPALRAAARRGGPIVPVYVWAPEEEGDWPPGAASRFWLHHSLRSLDQDLRRRGSRLILRAGATLQALLDCARQARARTVVYSRRTEPAARLRDDYVARSLKEAGLEVEACDGHLLFPPDAIRTRSGEPYQVFTPFFRACTLHGDPPPPLPVPASLPPPAAWPAGVTLASLALEPRPDWAEGLRFAWRPGEGGARARLDAFLAGVARDYPTLRDRPAGEGTSRLSPHLHFGEISPRAVFHGVRRFEEGSAGPGAGSAFLRELVWREFAAHLLHHFPHTPEEPLRKTYRHFPWRRDPAALRAWQRGRTGYPLVDAGMRELWTTGFMHNRVRMIVASFLLKDLLITWQEGAAWFWDTLVDADLASNTLGWQWSAGCGADAVPYFRIFNPVVQADRFDPEGEYVARFLPALRGLPPAARHQPWRASRTVLEAAGLVLDEDYPRPIVDHAAARRRALAAFQTVRGAEPVQAGPRLRKT
jgi:deoxyribodipyrimidine photo-lyase